MMKKAGLVGRVEYSYEACEVCQRDPVYGGSCDGPHGPSSRVTCDDDVICEMYLRLEGEMMDEKKPWITRATWGELREDVENAFLGEMESLTEPARDALGEMERRYEWAKGVGYDSGYSDGYDNGYEAAVREKREATTDRRGNHGE